MKTLFTIFISIGLFFFASEWDNDLKAAKELAENQNKLILLNFSGSDWCAPCILLKREVFNSEEFQNHAAEGLILLRADFPRLKKNKLSKTDTEKNEALAEKYNQEGKFPFTLLLDAQGNVLKSWDGYKKGAENEMIAEIKAEGHE